MTNKEAISRIKDHCEIHFKFEQPNAIKITEALNMAIKALEQQERDGWIPVSERLPKEHQEEDEDELDETYMVSDLVLVTVLDDNDNTFLADDITVGGEWVNFSDFNYCKVIAWKPMPEKYKGEIK